MTRFARWALALCLSSVLVAAPSQAREPEDVGVFLIGGEAGLAHFPSAVRIVGGCSATRVGPRHLLLAAHCVTSNNGNTSAQYRNGSQLLLARGPRRQYVRIAATHVFPHWRNAPSVLRPAVGIDVAMIVTRQNLNIVQEGTMLISRRIGDGEVAWVTGFGCRISIFQPEAGNGQFRFGSTFTLPPHFILPPNPAYFGADDQRYPATASNYLITAGRSMEARFASICPGDSGGGVYANDGTEGTVIGVNSYYTFPANSGVSFTNWHTRLDVGTRGGVGQWLSGFGANVR